MEEFKEDIEKAVACLTNGGVILYPTDTIWGLGCDATNPIAVSRIYDIKNRSDSKSMLVLLDNEFKLRTYVEEVPEIAYELHELSDKPLTIVYDGAKNLAQNLVAEDGSIGIRITRESFSKRLVERFKKPIVSTSANISGSPAPAHFYQVADAIINAVDYVVEYRQRDKTEAMPSGIIKVQRNGGIKVIRE